MTTAMTATRKPAKIQPKTATAHPGWSETSNSEANTWVWGLSWWSLRSRRLWWLRTCWQAIGWCQWLHVFVIFGYGDLDGCCGYDDQHDQWWWTWGWGTWYWGERRITMSEERSSPPRSRRPTKKAEQTSLPPSIVVSVRFLVQDFNAIPFCEVRPWFNTHT